MKRNVNKQSFLLVTFLLVLFSVRANATSLDSNSTEVIHQEWTSLGESAQLIDFSARVVGCNGVNQVMLNLFNENPTQQTVTFSIRVLNVDGREFTTPFNYTIGLAEMNIAACGDITYDNLKITLPGDYDATTVQIFITF